MPSSMLFIVLSLYASTSLFGQAPIRYDLRFPEPVHRWMEIEIVFPDVGTKALELRMSRSSPGRYALHEFGKNLYGLQAFDGKGRPLSLIRPDPYSWMLRGHDGTVRVRYKIYGDRVDGTYLAIDSTHAHINIPASLLWAKGLEERSVQLRLERPAGKSWRVATQLFPTEDPLEFSAPNLQYLMDSPIEFSDFSLRSFTIATKPSKDSTVTSNKLQTFRIALHHEGTEEEFDSFAAEVEKIAREERALLGELPEFDGGTYTFIADYLPYAAGDGMEHRNSTILTSASALGNEKQRQELLGTVAHEFFHSWNVERIRPKSLEPFDFERVNMSGELWLAEGFTSYYAALILERTGISELSDTLKSFTEFINVVALRPGRSIRSAVQMSRLDPLVDEVRSVDRPNWRNTFISYYTFGAAIGLALDLALREKTRGRVSLDDYMRTMWHRYGKVKSVTGMVAAPYTSEDARTCLAEVVGDPVFADQFFERYIQGRELPDYPKLLSLAGLHLERKNPGSAWIGDVPLEFAGGVGKVTASIQHGSPAYVAGLEQDDNLVALNGFAISSSDRLERFLKRHHPGEKVTASFIRRGVLVIAPLVLEEDPRLEIVRKDADGQKLSGSEKSFRNAWLGSNSN